MKPQTQHSTPEQMEALKLQAEYVAWRQEAGLHPTSAEWVRLERWTRLAARSCGVLFAPWSVR